MTKRQKDNQSQYIFTWQPRTPLLTQMPVSSSSTEKDCKIQINPRQHPAFLFVFGCVVNPDWVCLNIFCNTHIAALGQMHYWPPKQFSQNEFLSFVIFDSFWKKKTFLAFLAALYLPWWLTGWLADWLMVMDGDEILRKKVKVLLLKLFCLFLSFIVSAWYGLVDESTRE